MVTFAWPPLPSSPQATVGTPDVLVVLPHPVWFARVKVSSMVLLAAGVGVAVAPGTGVLVAVGGMGVLLGVAVAGGVLLGVAVAVGVLVAPVVDRSPYTSR